MQVTADVLNFKPPRPGRWGKPVVLALVAHALLMAALTWGVHWKQDEPPVAFEAEIWSALPREAAPGAVQPPPPPPPEPEQVKPEPKPEPRPEPKPAPPPPQPTVKQPDIATEKAKKKLEEDKKRELEEDKKEKALKDKVEREKKEKELADKKKGEEQKKLAEKKKQDQERKEQERREELAELAADKNRKDQIARMMGQAGASGGPEARGSAQRSEGPSSGYGARVQAKVRPNIRYSEEFPRSLRTEIEVRATPDGSITSRRVVDSSGNPAWDEAALKAIDRTGSLPRDVDGRVPSPIIIVVRPTD
jgi:colicin import membrane protein